MKLIDADKLLERLKKEAKFCIKEKFNEKNTRFYLGRETVLTDIIKLIESDAFDPDPIPLPTIKQYDAVRHPDYGEGFIKNIEGKDSWVSFKSLDYDLLLPINDLELITEVAEDGR